MTTKDDFWHRLNTSPWKIAICEMGLGVPFANAITRVPGASATLIYSECLYHKGMQPDIGHSSVSREMATVIADRLKRQALSHGAAGSKNLVSICVTGSHKRVWERGETHGWVVAVTPDYATHAMHFSIPKLVEDSLEPLGSHAWLTNCREVEVTRTEAIDRTLKAVQIFLSHVLEPAETRQWSMGSQPDINIDVFSTLTMEDHLDLLNVRNPLLYHRGQFHRTTSYIRRYKKILRGSFDPVTKAHMKIGGKDSIFEISVHNAEKGIIKKSDLIHRIRMLDAIDVPVMITKECPTFVDLHRMLAINGIQEDITYPVGHDTMSRIVSDQYVPSEGYLDPLCGIPQANFEVWFPSDGAFEPLPPRATKLLRFTTRHESMPHRSTSAREGDLSAIDPRVQEYIRKHRLYGIRQPA